MSAKILCLGLSRTGTRSLAQALTRLGFRTAHFAEHFRDQRGVGTWFAGNFEPDALADYDAAADLPIPTYFAQLDRRYPGSKFILTIRDLDGWLESVRKHWQRYLLLPDAHGQYRTVLRLATYGVTDFSAERFRWVYERHLRDVEEHFRQRNHDLLVLDVCGGEGWERLCAFLNRPVPHEPFPFENQGDGPKPALPPRPTPPPQQHPTAAALPPAPFIVGAARSGTTLLRLMLDAHPHLAIPPETHFLPEVVQGCQTAPHPAEHFLQSVTANPRWHDFGLDARQLRRRIEALNPFHLAAAVRAFYLLYAEKFGKSRYGDKSPTYTFHLSLIHQLLPEAKFLHLIRDGRDAALSMKETWFRPNSVAEAARIWVARVQSARAQAIDPRQYLEIRYEDLVLHTEATLRTICQFLELPWDAAVLDYHRQAAHRLEELGAITLLDGTVIPADRRRAIHDRVTQPPEPSRIGRWKVEMTGEERQQFEQVAGETLRALGYEVS